MSASASASDCCEPYAGFWLTLSVVAEAHSGLAEANGVLSSADSIELFKLGLVDALQGVIG